MFLFGNKDGLVRALLARARADELAALEQLRAPDDRAPPGLRGDVRRDLVLARRVLRTGRS